MAGRLMKVVSKLSISVNFFDWWKVPCEGSVCGGDIWNDKMVYVIIKLCRILTIKFSTYITTENYHRPSANYVQWTV